MTARPTGPGGSSRSWPSGIRGARVITVDHLPPGWLGKTHALWIGAQQTSGAWLLFADGDVVFDPCWGYRLALSRPGG